MHLQRESAIIDGIMIVKEDKRMWVARDWKDYEVLDTSAGEKLER